MAPPARRTKAGPAAYLLLRGDRKRRTQAGPTWSASFLGATVLHCAPERFEEHKVG